MRRTTDALNDYFTQARDRVANLSSQLLCVKANVGRISLCQGATAGEAAMFMGVASADASRAGRDAQSDEIDRLRDELVARSEQRDAARDEQSEAVGEGLERELDEAKRRLERLGR